MDRTMIAVAGATGDLGGRIVAALAGLGARPVAIVRPGTAPAARAALERAGAQVRETSLEAPALTEAMRGAACLVSAVNGLEEVIVGAQGLLLDAAVAAGVPRIIPSDFALDYTKTVPGENRNLDLRRVFRARLDAAPVRATSILNGAFSTVLTEQAPILLPRIARVLHWGEADQGLDFTTKDDVALYTAHAALDPDAPRDLRIAGGSASPRELAAIASGLSGRRWGTLRAGGIGRLSLLIGLTRTLAPSAGEVFPPWQGMQYLRDMMSGRGRLEPLDNARYGMTGWTGLRAMMDGVV